MRKSLLISGLFLALTTIGCSGAFWGGAGSGTVATGAGYEINSKAQMDRITKDLANGTITQDEYNIRKDQIKRMSIAY